MYRLEFKIETLSPVVISAASNSTLMTGSHDEISGSAIRGILGARYVQEKKLGNNAHANKEFQKLFYGGLKFLSATPAIGNKRSFTLPLSLQRGKKGTADENNILDLMTVDKTPAGYKSLRGYGIVDGDKIFNTSIQKNIFMHMSRSESKERISGKSEEGHIYNYEALVEGQTFFGQILGAADDLKNLNLEIKNFETRLGRSKFTQYGNCKFTFGNIEKIETQNLGEKIYLRLESPLISADDNFISAEKVLQAEVIDKLGANFTLGKVFAAGVEVENFVMKWGMKRPRVQALAAGTVFEIETENLTDADKNNLCEKMYSGFGVRTEEGFGQLRFWKSQEKFEVGKLEKNNSEEIETLSDETKEIAQKILLEKYLEQLRIYAHEDAKTLTSQLQRGNFTHFFSRLHNILANVGAENTRQNFADKILAASKDGTQFQDNLKNLYLKDQTLKDQTLYDIFTANANLPYEDKEFSIGDEKLFDKIDFNAENFADRFCFEYLQHFLRFARKIAATKGGDEID